MANSNSKLSHYFLNQRFQNKFLKLATTKKTTTKKTSTKKEVGEKSSKSIQDESLLKKNGIDEMSLDELLKFAKKEKVDFPENIDETERVNVVLPVLAHFAQKADLLLGFGVLDILNDGYGFLRNLQLQ